jgi:hypothetical protein
MSRCRVTPRDAVCLGLGALAYPLGCAIGWLLENRNRNH